MNNPAHKSPPTYVTRSFEIEPGGSVSHVRVADFVTVLDAPAAFKVSFDNGSATELEAGITIKTVNGFERVEFVNPTNLSMSIKVAFGKGDVRDARLVFNGDITTKDISGQTLADVIGKLDDLAAASTASNAIDLTNSSYKIVTASGAGTTAANLDLPPTHPGLRIDHLILLGGSTDSSRMTYDGNKTVAFANASESLHLRNIIIPANENVTLSAGGSGGSARAWYSFV